MVNTKYLIQISILAGCLFVNHIFEPLLLFLFLNNSLCNWIPKYVSFFVLNSYSFCCAIDKQEFIPKLCEINSVFTVFFHLFDWLFQFRLFFSFVFFSRNVRFSIDHHSSKYFSVFDFQVFISVLISLQIVFDSFKHCVSLIELVAKKSSF